MLEVPPAATATVSTVSILYPEHTVQHRQVASSKSGLLCDPLPGLAGSDLVCYHPCRILRQGPWSVQYSISHDRASMSMPTGSLQPPWAKGCRRHRAELDHLVVGRSRISLMASLSAACSSSRLVASSTKSSTSFKKRFPYCSMLMQMSIGPYIQYSKVHYSNTVITAQRPSAIE